VIVATSNLPNEALTYRGEVMVATSNLPNEALTHRRSS
jgi:hypothetical protein